MIKIRRSTAILEVVLSFPQADSTNDLHTSWLRANQKQGARKGREVPKRCVALMFPEGRRVGMPKRRVRRHLCRRAMKKCTPLWSEVHLEVKFKNCWGRSTFGSGNVKKSACHCGAKHVWKYKVLKIVGFGALFEVMMSKRCTPSMARRTFGSANVKGTTRSDHFWTSRRRFVWQAQVFLHLVKVS